MSVLGERTLIQHLVDVESLRTLLREGLDTEAIPTADLRPIIDWAINYFARSGLTQAPSLEALRGAEYGNHTFGKILDDFEVEMETEPENTIEWAIDDLKASYIRVQATNFNKSFATEMASVAADERIDVLARGASRLVTLSLNMVRKDRAVDMRESADSLIHDYAGRVETKGEFRGARLGLDMIDTHTYGIHDGELAIVAAPPKTGKSYMLLWSALAEWRVGRSPALFSLENSVEMTRDRLACLATGANYTKWQRGESSGEEIDAIGEFLIELQKSDIPFWILNPDLGRRSIESMVREAEVREAQTILIDQLTFIELPGGSKPKTERIGDALHRLVGMISTGRRPMPAIVAHQINREGVKAARKLGRLEMDHLAESAECERTAAWVFGGYASKDDIQSGSLRFEVLAARRAGLLAWELEWRPYEGRVKPRQVIGGEPT